MSTTRRSYFAVIRGHIPGVYDIWAECDNQIKNYNGARYKKFSDRASAEAYFAREFSSSPPPAPTPTFTPPPPEPLAIVHPQPRPAPSLIPHLVAPPIVTPTPCLSIPIPPRKPSPRSGASTPELAYHTPASTPPSESTMPKSKSGVYAVAVGRKPGLYFTWEECRQQTSGWHGSKHQKFISTSEAEDWLQQHGILVETTRTDEPPQTPTIAVFDNTDTVKPAKATQELTSQEPIWYDVYTDGACKGNQNADSKAGIGVWWGHNDPRNLSERCPGKQSNNCAELTAIVRALETAPDHYNLCIKTDSKYAIDAMTRWFQSWRFNEFKNSEGQEVVNLPILLHLNASLGRRTGMTKLEHVKGHSTSVGNNAADRLAVAGAEKDVVPDRKWEYGTWNRDEIVPFWQEVWQQRKKAREAGKQESPDEKKTRKSSVQFLVPPKDDALFDEERIPEIPSRSTEKSKQVKTEPPVISNQEWQVVYTDGGCKGNQGPDGRAGIGVWWGQQDLRNIAERCPGAQTNNRAELIAVIRALEEAPGDVPLIIRTDSKYVIDSMEKYLKKWIQNDFLTSSSGPVKNVPLIKHLNCLLGRRVGETKFEHVKGHSGEEGNEGADKLANRGSFMPEVREPNWLYANEEKVSFWMDTWKERREAQALAGFEFDESFLLDDDELSQLANTGEFD